MTVTAEVRDRIRAAIAEDECAIAVADTYVVDGEDCTSITEAIDRKRRDVARMRELLRA
jgi:hypothetical protein